MVVFHLAQALPIAGCVVFYGVQFVPAKLRSTYNGAVFQWFMSNGALFMGLCLGVMLVDDVPGGTKAGLLGGMLVAVSNAIILHLKRTLGLFTGVVVYQAANLITGYCVGRFGIFGAPPDVGRNPYLRDVGVVLLLVSLQLVSVSASITNQPKERARAMTMLSDPLIEVTEEDFRGCDPNTISFVISETNPDPDDLYVRIHEMRLGAQPGNSFWTWNPGISRAASEQLSRRASLTSGARAIFTLQGLAEEAEGSHTVPRTRSWPPMKGSESIGIRRGLPDPLLHSAPEMAAESPTTGSSEPPPEAIDPSVLAGMPDEIASQYSAAPTPRHKPSPAMRSFGGVMAVAAGVCRGMSPVPFAMWHRENPNTPSACFVFPMALGVWASSTVIYLSYTSCKKVLQLRSPAKPSIRPAFLSGCLWALGFACFAQSLDEIRYTATYMLSAIGPVLVSQLISVFVFKEIQETAQLRWFAGSCLVQFAGMSCIIMGT